jgi:hypothetical protein
MEQDEGAVRAVANLLASAAGGAASLSNAAGVKGFEGVKGSRLVFEVLLHLLLLVGNLAIDANGVWVWVWVWLWVLVCL